MPRRNSPKKRRPQGSSAGAGAGAGNGRSNTGGSGSFGLVGGRRVERGMGRQWTVQNVRGTESGRTYRCPGCQQYVAAHTAHVVAWPVREFGAVDDDDKVALRRHWHTSCWDARDRRPPMPW